MTSQTIKHVTAKGAPAPGGSYSHGVIANGFLYTCGMGPVDPATGKIVEGGVGPQTRQTLINLKAILDEVGADFSQVVKTTAHLQIALLTLRNTTRYIVNFYLRHSQFVQQSALI